MNYKYRRIWFLYLVAFASTVGDPLHVSSQVQNPKTRTASGSKEGDILAAWTFDPNNPNSGVNFQPLPVGRWEEQQWSEAQTARSSNNRQIRAPVAPMNAVRWLVESPTDDPNTISFNVSIDLPGSDALAWSNQRNNSIVPITPLPGGLTWIGTNQGGFYIATVRGAHTQFTVKAVATNGTATEPPNINSFIIAPRQIANGQSVSINWRVTPSSYCTTQVRLTQKNFRTDAILAVHNGLETSGTLSDRPEIDSNYFLDAWCDPGPAAQSRRVSVDVSNPTTYQFYCFKVVYPTGICSTFAYPAASESDAEQRAHRENPTGNITTIDCSQIASECGK